MIAGVERGEALYSYPACGEIYGEAGELKAGRIARLNVPYGITLPSQSSTATKPTPDSVMARTVQVLSGARFAYFRDSVSLELA